MVFMYQKREMPELLKASIKQLSTISSGQKTNECKHLKQDRAQVLQACHILYNKLKKTRFEHGRYWKSYKSSKNSKQG